MCNSPKAVLTKLAFSEVGHNFSLSLTIFNEEASLYMFYSLNSSEILDIVYSFFSAIYNFSLEENKNTNGFLTVISFGVNFI